MEAVIALFAKAAAAGRWALGMLELGVTVPLNDPHPFERSRGGASEPAELHPFTRLPMLVPGFDMRGTPESSASAAGEFED